MTTALSSSNARLAAARRLTRRSARHAAGRFLAEGPQAVSAALAVDAVLEVFGTAAALARFPALASGASEISEISEISEKDAAALSETVTPQGIVAVCRIPDVSLADVLARGPALLAVLHEPNDPGNLGTIIRTADAAAADAVVVCGGVDPYNGKCVRASAGSLFHLPVVPAAVEDVLAAGPTTFATSASGAVSLDELAADGTLARPTAWLFGSEAHGLPDAVLAGARHTVRIPIYGRAESLNLACAAAICLYASARAQQRS